MKDIAQGTEVARTPTVPLRVTLDPDGGYFRLRARVYCERCGGMAAVRNARDVRYCAYCGARFIRE